MKTLFSIFFCLITCLGYSQEEIRDLSTGTSFPGMVSFENEGNTYNLTATGVATRKKLFVNVYSVAHYLQDGAYKNNEDIISVILEDRYAKQLTLKWLRNVPLQKVQDGYQESFKNVLTTAQYANIQSEITNFIHSFQKDVVKDEIHVLRWLPNGTIEIYINNKKINEIANKNFAKSLWEIWFGSKSVVNRNNLISLIR